MAPVTSAQPSDAAAQSSAALRFARQSANTLFSLFITFIGLLAVTFFISRVIPIDPVTAILGERATGEQIAALTEKLGMNDPLWQQFGIYVWDVFHGRRYY